MRLFTDDKIRNIIIVAIIFLFIIQAFICYRLFTMPLVPEYIITEPPSAARAYTEEEPAAEALPPALYRAYISGEVDRPGVYTIEEGTRVSDLIDLAGGALPEADLEAVNLAAYVEDAKHIKIPKIGEEPPLEVSNEEAEAFDGLININTASLSQLVTLPGIGNVIGQNIIDYRVENGNFKSIDEIKNVNRIGDGVFSQIKDKITVE